jgi:FkbM family methyltransferase
MTDPNLIISYAQYREDIVLYSLLSHIENGFYIDVGANYPVIDSVTKLFYEKGWSGINIEPISDIYEQLRKDRNRDTNLNIGIGSKKGSLKFFRNDAKPGHSSFKKPGASSTNSRSKDCYVNIDTLKNVINTYAHKSDIDFIKIDVEGFELEVIKGNDWSKSRPKVLCIEANHAGKAWKAILTKNNFKLFINDGLNEYYIAGEHWGITQGYAERAVAISYHVLNQHHSQSWLDDSKQLTYLTKLNEEKENRIIFLEEKEKKVASLEKEVLRLKELKSLDLKDIPYTLRLKRATLGLSVDWLRYRKNKK